VVEMARYILIFSLHKREKDQKYASGFKLVEHWHESEEAIQIIYISIRHTFFRAWTLLVGSSDL